MRTVQKDLLREVSPFGRLAKTTDKLIMQDEL